MKKIAFALFSLFLTLFLFACAEKQQPHEHSFSPVLDYDNNGHFYTCEGDGCNEISGYSAHSFSGYTSDGPEGHSSECICGYKLTFAHSWDEGVITLEPTVEAEGQRSFNCLFCGAAYTEKIDKLPVDNPPDLEEDEEDSSDGGCGADDEAQPELHEHIPSDFLTDEDYHWRICEDSACRETINKTEHTFSDGVVTKAPTREEKGEISYTCTVCGRVKTAPIEYVIETTVSEEQWQIALNRDNFTAALTSVVFDVPESKLIKRDGDRIEEIMTVIDLSMSTYRVNIDGEWYGVVGDSLVPAGNAYESVGKLVSFDFGELSSYEYFAESSSYKSSDNELFFEDGYLVRAIINTENAVYTVDYYDYGTTKILNFPK